MISVMLAIMGMSLEISGISAVLLNGNAGRAPTSLLLQHSAAALMLALWAWRVMPARFRQPRAQVMLLMFNVAFFVPLLGMLGVLVAGLLSRYRRRSAVLSPFAAVPLPAFAMPLRAPGGKFGQGGIRSRLGHASVSPPQRLQSLLALQAMPPRISSALLHSMLADTSDDIRLVAYGLLDAREKAITAQILRERRNLETAERDDLRVMCDRHLAELYWELVYSGLARGDLRTHALDQGLFHAESALRLSPEQQGLLLLKGRILHAMGRDGEALQVLTDAIAGGLPESRALPYVLEILFARGDYDAVRGRIAGLSDAQATPSMKETIRFWLGSPAERRMTAKKAR